MFVKRPHDCRQMKTATVVDDILLASPSWNQLYGKSLVYYGLYR